MHERTLWFFTGTGVSNIRPRGLNWSGRDNNPVHETTFENRKEDPNLLL